MPETSPQASAEYCRRLCEAGDPDRYACTLPARNERQALWAALAFHIETGRVITEVTIPQAGLIRLQWWRDALENGDTASNAVLAELARHGVPHAPLHALLDLRCEELVTSCPESDDELAARARATALPLLDIAAHVANAPSGYAPLAAAYGLCGMARSLTWHAASGRCTIPAPVLFEMGLAPEQVDHIAPNPRLNDFVESLCARAATELAAATIPPHPFFEGQARIVRLFLKRIAKAGYDPFDTRVSGPYPFLSLRLLLGIG